MPSSLKVQHSVAEASSPINGVEDIAVAAGLNGSSENHSESEANLQINNSLVFSQLFDELGEAVLLSDNTGRITRANKAAVRILRMSEDELTSLTHDDPIWQAVKEDGTPIPIEELPATKALRTKEAVSGMEIGVVRRDGTLTWILESAAPLLDEAGNVHGVITTFPEVTLAVRQRQTLKELSDKYQRERDRANEANRLKSAFLANMSHEIRTPMTAILGFSDVLASELSGKVSDQHYTFLRSINVSGKRLLNLINDILDLSKIESGRIEVMKDELDISNEIEAAITPLTWIAKQKNLAVQIEPPPERLIIRGDRHRLGQVLTNIISNAIKFTRKGSITIRTLVTGKGKTRQVVIEVEDTGIGISKEFMPSLFEEFRQEQVGNTKEFGGTGLGLAISRKLVTMMEGTIHVRTQEGVGSVFSIVFPLVATNREPIAPLPPLPIPEGPMVPAVEVPVPTGPTGKHVLVVEDNSETQRLLDAYLRGQYRVSKAANAQMAIEAINKEVPDLIIMDVNLPGRDGLSITREIRSGTICPRVPIVALTAFAMTGDRQKCIEAGCDDYLSKPATRREVLEMVGKLMGKTAAPVMTASA
jgi:PAS domain S-box-containing protein